VTLKRSQGAVLVLASLALIAGACSSSKSSTGGGGGGGATTTIAPKQGGDLVVAAEQEPDCMDWIDGCAGAAWGVYTVEANTMPKAYDFTSDSKYVPSNVLAGPATLVSSPTQTVTYHINPQAVWSDGQPITSADFQYTWDQIANGKNIYDTTGYANVASVATPDAQTAVATFKTPYADWPYLFSGFYGIFPSHLLKGKDRDALMKAGYTWSGGPWMMDHWTKGVEVKLVPNPKYWGQAPLPSRAFPASPLRPCPACRSRRCGSTSRRAS
jgi:peptide/nickel transport system substrate-binding protein